MSVRVVSAETRRKMSESARARARRQWDDPEWAARFRRKMASAETRERMSSSAVERGKRDGAKALRKWQRENMEKHRAMIAKIHADPVWRANRSVMMQTVAEERKFVASIHGERDRIKRLAASDRMPKWYYDTNSHRPNQDHAKRRGKRA